MFVSQAATSAYAPTWASSSAIRALRAVVWSGLDDESGETGGQEDAELCPCLCWPEIRGTAREPAASCCSTSVRLRLESLGPSLRGPMLERLRLPLRFLLLSVSAGGAAVAAVASGDIETGLSGADVCSSVEVVIMALDRVFERLLLLGMAVGGRYGGSFRACSTWVADQAKPHPQ